VSSHDRADRESSAMPDGPAADDDPDRPLSDWDLGLLQLSTVLYYLHETNPDNGLVRDKTDPNAPSSIAACPRSRLAHAPAAAGELSRLLRDVSVEGDLRPRAALLGAALHAPALAPVDRLPRDRRRVHA
jgi:hypothetical protein